MLSIGTWITIPHISIVEILADAGFDWICIDMEHTAIDYGDALNLIALIQGKGIKAYVRVGENNARIIKRVLDAGADGIIVPSVNSFEEAKKAIEAFYYPPIGNRGVGLSRAQNYGFGFDEYKDGLENRERKLIVQIEHYKAVEDLNEILRLDLIDGAFIGPYDLSASIGLPGKFDNERVIGLINQFEATCKNFPDKWMGFHVIKPDHELLKSKIQSGYNFLAFSLDFLFLGEKVKAEMNQIKGGME